MCSHPDVEPVTLVTGETVATICVHCLQRLPAEWGCDDCEWVLASTLSGSNQSFVSARCDEHSRRKWVA